MRVVPHAAGVTRRLGLVTILDSKRNDIASTAEAYADAAFAGTPHGPDRHVVWPADEGDALAGLGAMLEKGAERFRLLLGDAEGSRQQLRGDIARANEHWSLARPLSELDLEAPESVRGMIHKKIYALQEPQRRALAYASIEGEEFLYGCC